MNKSVLMVCLVVVMGVAMSMAAETKTSSSSSAVTSFNPPTDILEGLTRLKRGHGGGGGGGYGHGPGSGGGAAGPVYICGYIGSKEGYGGGYGK